MFSKLADALGSRKRSRGGGRFERFDRTFGGHQYETDQPRVPAGQPDGGQWTRGTGGAIGSGLLSHLLSGSSWLPAARHPKPPHHNERRSREAKEKPPREIKNEHIKEFRKANPPHDLFDRHDNPNKNTVT